MNKHWYQGMTKDEALEWYTKHLEMLKKEKMNYFPINGSVHNKEKWKKDLTFYIKQIKMKIEEIKREK